MEKSCLSSASLLSSSTTNNNSVNTVSSSSTNNNTASSAAHINTSLKSLNKASYKISKTITRNPVPIRAAEAAAATVPVSGSGGAPPPQPPVYNIDKNDFRNVVQKLTGSPAHHHPSPVAPPTPAPALSSRLHRIRPPPLAHLFPGTPLLIPAHPAEPWTRPPLSPLPPLPTVNATAESPISAYMRRLHGGSGGLSGLLPSPTSAPLLSSLSSPLAFGCPPSPQTAYQMMMAPGLVLPTSPGVQLSSPRLGNP